jgi:hypothetical protein
MCTTPGKGRAPQSLRPGRNPAAGARDDQNPVTATRLPGRSPRAPPGRSPRAPPGRSPRAPPGRSPRAPPGRSPRAPPGGGAAAGPNAARGMLRVLRTMKFPRSCGNGLLNRLVVSGSAHHPVGAGHATAQTTPAATQATPPHRPRQPPRRPPRRADHASRHAGHATARATPAATQATRDMKCGWGTGGAARVRARRAGVQWAETDSRTRAAVSLGVRPTRTPTFSRASFLACAVPAEPEMIAPAWPMVLPSGAVKPAT